MCYHTYKDNSILFQILKVAKRQLIITAYSFQASFSETINSKNRNNHKFILHESAIFNRDTMKVRKHNINYNVKLAGHLKSVVPSRFFRIGSNQT
jgi:hypothetical protein